MLDCVLAKTAVSLPVCIASIFVLPFALFRLTCSLKKL